MRLNTYLITYNKAIVNKNNIISLGSMITTTIKAESRDWAIRELLSKDFVYCIVTLREIRVIVPLRERIMAWLGKEIN